MSKTKPFRGEFFYAIAALEKRRDKIRHKPGRFADPAEHIKSINAALEMLRLNDFPVGKERRVPLSQLYDEEFPSPKPSKSPELDVDGFLGNPPPSK